MANKKSNSNKSGVSNNQDDNYSESKLDDPRRDSLSIFSVNNQPRLSNTEVSIASFLNIADQNATSSDNNNTNNSSGGMSAKANTSQNKSAGAKSAQKSSNSISKGSVVGGAANPNMMNPDMSAIGRGFSIVNSMWPQQPQQQMKQSNNNNNSNYNNGNQGQFQIPQSRNNSLKFPVDDLDFQFRRNSSIIRAANMPPANVLAQQQYQYQRPSVSAMPQQGTLQPQQQLINGQGLMYPQLQQIMTNYPQQRVQETATQPPAKKQKTRKPRKNSKKGRNNSAAATGNKDETKSKQNLQNVSPDLDKENAVYLNNNNNNSNNNKLYLDVKLQNDAAGLGPQSTDTSRGLLGVTKVDQLMLIIEARKKGVTEKIKTTDNGELILDRTTDILPPSNQLVGGVEKPKSSHGMKQHECPYCHRFFTQSTHLEVHVRSHIGYKPFQCEFCGKRFTQGGNLRTHQRLHTGEKPYNCEMCGKRFSRKGNLAAHALTHQKLKPYICKLENCNKSFTQLGNMKAHQNRFHLKTLMRLTSKLASMNENTDIPKEERELLEYLATIYKNSNKGIKGRGKNANNGISISMSSRLSGTGNSQILQAQQLGNINGLTIPGSLSMPGHMMPDNTTVLMDPSKEMVKLPSPTHNLQSDKIGGVNYEFAPIQNQQQNLTGIPNSNEFDFNLEQQGVPKGMTQHGRVIQQQHQLQQQQQQQQQPFHERVHFNDINFKG
ncbi:hypothetical protein TPHA_0B02910 [Tetrapisispora phaffii CBS 4417]|uniref:C2H2-type domain-containing protein n=1 Tax=Tetrapisispora phaffii (strain ATCC 24235 / CBS 4417 / NBRC 1672 / NRRL Y-8282 / UCD 70-5) TaxID=1071381 RepID=G8BPN2_TETPH|nr:hypothetical protein TPHA_0B02910 [Tetrapisispora phaffii CBS 4417]CCE61963.1 hypothetical protein TPHA_0B02910 [Tetrapisispora phaffii CBS 4417]